MSEHDSASHARRSGYASPPPKQQTPGRSTASQHDTGGGTWNGQPYKGSVFGATSVSPALKARADGLLAIVEKHVELVEKRVADSGHLPEDEAKTIRDALARDRTEIMEVAMKLPSGSELQDTVMRSGDRVTFTINELDALINAYAARSSTSQDAARGDTALILKEAEERVPAGFCDRAPQGKAPCELDPVQRSAFRSRVRDTAGQMSSSWGLAINAVKVDEKFRSQEVPFSAVLGELLLGLLFNGLAALGKYAVKKGIEAGEKALTTTEHMEGFGFSVTDKVHPNAHTVERAHSIGDKVVEKGADVARNRVKEGALRPPIDTAELAEKAKEGFSVPDDRDAFLGMMKKAPSTWFMQLTRNTDRLFDADLAALVVALPSDDKIDQASYEHKVRDLLRRFDEQVQSIGPFPETTVVKVALPRGGVRQALITADTAADSRLQGEWKNSNVRTGKRRFVRWIDDDMREMAVAKASEHDETAGAQVRMGTDANFWASESLEAFAHAPLANGEQP